jgi:hypothetical protein
VNFLCFWEDTLNTCEPSKRRARLRTWSTRRRNFALRGIARSAAVSKVVELAPVDGELRHQSVRTRRISAKRRPAADYSLLIRRTQSAPSLARPLNGSFVLFPPSALFVQMPPIARVFSSGAQFPSRQIHPVSTCNRQQGLLSSRSRAPPPTPTSSGRDRKNTEMIVKHRKPQRMKAPSTILRQCRPAARTATGLCFSPRQCRESKQAVRAG